MSKKIDEIYSQLYQFIQISDIESIKQIITKNFKFLCNSKLHNHHFIHKIIESEKFEILDAIFETFDKNFNNPDLSPRYKAIEATARKQFFDQADDFGDTPLMLSARYGKADFLLKFLQNHADVEHVNCFSSNALLEATEEQSTEMVLILRSYNADVYKKNADGMTPLDLAYQKENSELYSALLIPKKDSDETAPVAEEKSIMLQPQHAEDLIQLLKNRNIEGLKFKLNELAAQSEDNKVEISPLLFKITEDNLYAFKLLIHYKNGFHPIDMMSEEDAFSADETPDNNGSSAASDCSTEPGESSRIVGTPEHNDLALTVGVQ